MKARSSLLACALLLTSTTALADTVPPSGKDEKVEWKVASRWQIEAAPLDIVYALDGQMVFILDDQHRVLVYNNRGQLLGKVPVGKGVTAIDIAPRGEALYLIDGETKNFTSLDMSYIQDIDITGAPVKGKADAPVTVVVFTDFECPYCAKLVPLLDQVFEKNSDTIKIAFKNYPLTNLHKMAEAAHRAAMAADNQGKFWEFHDRLFSAGHDGLTPEFITKTAKDLSLDMQKFEKDRASNEVTQRIRKDLIDGERARVTGTPTVFINGRRLPQRSLNTFQAIIDEELAESGK